MILSRTGNFNVTSIDESIVFILDKIEIQEKTTFLDYIFGGCEVVLNIAVDFAESEYQEKHADYINAMTQIGSLLEHYDSDRYIGLYGFNGKLPGNDIYSSKCFALNGKFYDPEVKTTKKCV